MTKKCEDYTVDIHQVTISGARVEYADSSRIGTSFFLLHVLHFHKYSFKLYW